MKGTRYREEQIIRILKEADAGAKVQDLCRKYGMSDATFYNWKNKFGGMSLPDAKRLKILEDENRRLKKIVAEQVLDIQVLKDINSKNW
jgi:putative transposase